MATPPISPPLARALAARGYTELTPVQQAVIDWPALDRDLIVSAQTGSGKTVAYGLGLASTLLGEAELLGEPGLPVALVIAPTRELALQVRRELAWLYADAGAEIAACVGGMDPRRERRRLEEGAHIVVGTPGRLRDHLQRGALDLSALRAVVLDEADEMLDLGFREDLEFILEAAPEDRRTLLFSATLPRGIVALAGRYQRDAHRIEAAASVTGHADIEYRVVRVVPHEVEHAVVNVLRQIDPPSAIVFANTRDGVRHLQATLTERGFSAVLLSGELGQHERNQALQALRDGRARICVATDVAARGIDLPNLGLVVHAELPINAEILQHRSGRTGRAGRKGVSVLVVPPGRRRRAEQILAEAGVQAVWGTAPDADEIRALDRQRLLSDPMITEEPTEDDRAMGAVLLAERSVEDIAAALARLYRSRLPAPEEITDPGPDRQARAKGDAKPGERPARPAGDTVWFRMDVGRKNRADPKWLLPMLCRRGKITRQDIGAIRILDTVTEFEVAAAAAEHFAVNARRADGDDIAIEPLPAGAPRGTGPRPAKPARPGGEKPKGGKWADRKGGFKHAREGFKKRKQRERD